MSEKVKVEMEMGNNTEISKFLTYAIYNAQK